MNPAPAGYLVEVASDRPSPLAPVPVAAVTRGLFRALSRARRARVEGNPGARVLHPDGIGFAAKLEISGAEHASGTLLARRRAHPAIVRLSRAVGLPGGTPEPLGVAVRLVDAHGVGEHQDLLFASSAQSPLARHAPLPSFGGFFHSFFSTLLPYGVGGRVRMLGLAPVNGGSSPRDLATLAGIAQGRCYRLCIAPLGAPWLSVGQIEIGERLPDEVIEALRFNPWNTGDGLRPLGPLMGLRDAAYAGSQRGRLPAEEGGEEETGASGNGRGADARLAGRTPALRRRASAG